MTSTGPRRARRRGTGSCRSCAGPHSTGTFPRCGCRNRRRTSRDTSPTTRTAGRRRGGSYTTSRSPRQTAWQACWSCFTHKPRADRATDRRHHRRSQQSAPAEAGTRHDQPAQTTRRPRMQTPRTRTNRDCRGLALAVPRTATRQADTRSQSQPPPRPAASTREPTATPPCCSSPPNSRYQSSPIYSACTSSPPTAGHKRQVPDGTHTLRSAHPRHKSHEAMPGPAPLGYEAGHRVSPRRELARSSRLALDTPHRCWVRMSQRVAACALRCMTSPQPYGPTGPARVARREIRHAVSSVATATMLCVTNGSPSLTHSSCRASETTFGPGRGQLRGRLPLSAWRSPYGRAH